LLSIAFPYWPPLCNLYDLTLARGGQLHTLSTGATFWVNVQAGWITDMEALNALLGHAASMIPTDIDGDRTMMFVDDVAAVLTDISSAGNKYFKQAKRLGQSGFDPAFQDPAGPGGQPYHFWTYVYLAYHAMNDAGLTIGIMYASAGNYAHETFVGGSLGHLFGEFEGRSYQDYALGVEGVRLAESLYLGLNIECAGLWVQNNVGVGGWAVDTYFGSSWDAEARRLAYAGALALSAATLWPTPADGQGGQNGTFLGQVGNTVQKGIV